MIKVKSVFLIFKKSIDKKKKEKKIPRSHVVELLHKHNKSALNINK